MNIIRLDGHRPPVTPKPEPLPKGTRFKVRFTYRTITPTTEIGDFARCGFAEYVGGGFVEITDDTEECPVEVEPPEIEFENADELVEFLETHGFTEPSDSRMDFRRPETLVGGWLSDEFDFIDNDDEQIQYSAHIDVV